MKLWTAPRPNQDNANWLSCVQHSLRLRLRCMSTRRSLPLPAPPPVTCRFTFVIETKPWDMHAACARPLRLCNSRLLDVIVSQVLNGRLQVGCAIL